MFQVQTTIYANDLNFKNITQLDWFFAQSKSLIMYQELPLMVNICLQCENIHSNTRQKGNSRVTKKKEKWHFNNYQKTKALHSFIVPNQIILFPYYQTSLTVPCWKGKTGCYYIHDEVSTMTRSSNSLLGFMWFQQV